MTKGSPHSNNGFSMIEILVSIVILAFGLLGLAGMQIHIQSAEMESYQRAQALVLLEDMAERMVTNRSIASTYASNNTYGTNDSEPDDCTGKAIGTADRDLCEWSNALKGSAEISDAGSKIGAMVGARGCVTEVQAANSAAGICAPGIYRVDIVWQGLNATTAPAVDCGRDEFGDDTKRRAISRAVTIGVPGCT